MILTSTIKDRSLWFLIFLGSILYFQHAWVTGMFPDGHLYMSFGKNAADKGFWLVPHLTKSTYPDFGDHIPFVFMLEGLFFKVFGASYTSARIFSGLFSLMTMIGIYKFLKPKNKTWAFYAAFLFLIIPPLLKKTRFPSLDTPMMFFSFLSLYFFYKYTKKKSLKLALLSGFMWGACLLCKGPIAFFVPLASFIYIIIIKKYDVFTSWKSYLIAVSGLCLFSIWPIALYMTDNFEIFDKYINTTFIHTAKNSRGKVSPEYFAYFIFLVKQTLPWIIFSFLSIKYYIKKKDNQALFAIISFCSLIIPLSLFSHKYSHYLVALFPWFAIISAYIFVSWEKKTFICFFRKKGIAILSCVVAALLLIFPLTIKSSRDSGLRDMFELTTKLEKPPLYWGIVNNSYPFFNVNNLAAYRSSAETFLLTTNSLHKILKNENVTSSLEMKWPVPIDNKRWALLVDKNTWMNVKVKGNYRAIASFKSDNLLLVIYSEDVDFRLHF